MISQGSQLFHIACFRERNITAKNFQYLNLPILQCKKSLKKTKNYNILYNAPYSPHLNPIELAFGHIKRELRKNSPHNQFELISRLFHLARSINIIQSRAFFYSSLKYIKICLKGHNLLWIKCFVKYIQMIYVVVICEWYTIDKPPLTKN